MGRKEIVSLRLKSEFEAERRECRWVIFFLGN